MPFWCSNFKWVFVFNWHFWSTIRKKGQFLGEKRKKRSMHLPLNWSYLCIFLLIQTADAAWAISYVTDEDGDRIQAVIDAGCVPSLVRLLDHNENSIVVPALRSVGNIVTGSDFQVNKNRFNCQAFLILLILRGKHNFIQRMKHFWLISWHFHWI